MELLAPCGEKPNRTVGESIKRMVRLESTD